MRILFLAVLLGGQCLTIDVSLDMFHGLNQQLFLSVEQPVDIQESVGIGLTYTSLDHESARVTMVMIDPMYRRYIKETTSEGGFYSFGVRAGQAKVEDSETKENQLAIKPYYNLGYKGAFNNRWSHLLTVEVGYLMLYTDSINITPMLGLQVTPYFAFGYTLDPVKEGEG